MTPAMTPERWQQIKAIFDEALDCETGRREAFLAEACANDAELRAEVETLLAGHRAAEGFINQPAAAQAAHLLDFKPAVDILIGTQVGPYKVLQEIGHGGMGQVYLAVRADDEYKKRVALKVVKRGMDTQDVIRRFRSERQILAGLDHPNIAKLLDGGTTEDGLPYFAMEYVEGKPITDYCDHRKLPTSERLKLFRQICAAVQFAHQNLIVHRDLKPGNILVTEDGTPKLLDFGIAKLLNPELSALTIDPTLTAMRLMTPEYASPEQVRGENVTTASDVYSLGVVLYELLTGHRPYRVKSRSLHDIVRIVCEEEPEKPSTAVSRVDTQAKADGTTHDITPASVSRARADEPERLQRRLRGDLDNIVLMAMRKEAHRRYTTVNQLSEDIRRHLEGLPVVASKDTWSYRAEKFVHRNRVSVLTAALLLITLLGGVAATWWQAKLARARFNDLRQLANSLLFEVHDEIEKLPGSTPTRQLIVKRALEYLDRLARQAGSDRTLQFELAAAYLKVGDVQGNPNGANLGDTTGALSSYRKAATILESVPLSERSDRQSQRKLSTCYNMIGDILSYTNDLAGAQESYRKSLAFSEAIAATNRDAEVRADLATALGRLGDVLKEMGDTSSALEHHRKALAERESLVASNPTDKTARHNLTRSLDNVADLVRRSGDTAAALELSRKSLALREALAADFPTDARVQRSLAISYSMFGGRLADSGKQAEAIDNIRKALHVFEELAAADQQNAQARRDLGLTYKKLADQLVYAGKPAEAMPLYQKAISIREQLVVADPKNAQSRHDVMIIYNDIADALGHPDFVNLGDKPGALSYYRKALAITEELATADPNNLNYRTDLWLSYNKIGQMLEAMGDQAKALTHYRKALPIAEAFVTADPAATALRRKLAGSRELLGNLLTKMGDLTTALNHQQRAWEIREKVAVADKTSVDAQSDLALSCGEMGDVYLAMATNTKTSVNERMLAWQNARTWYAKASDHWRSLATQNAIIASYAKQPDEIAAKLKRCETEIAKSTKN